MVVNKLFRRPEILLVLLLFAACVFSVCRVVYTDTFYEGIYIDGFHIGGLTRNEALGLLQDNMDRILHKKAILLYAPQGQYRLPLSDIGYMLDYPEALERAYALGKTGSLPNRLKEIGRLKKTPLQISPKICYNKEKVGKILDSIHSDIEKKPVNAAVKRIHGKMEVTAHQTGEALDKDSCLKKIEDVLVNRTFDDIYIERFETLPDITTKMVEQITFRLGEFSTAFNPSNEDRAHNIKVACGRIHQKLLLAGEVFSMDQALGDRSEKNGYRPARVIVNYELVDGLGGGICQVTSTLYNTILLSGLEIVERRNHTLPLSYIGIGRDATIAQGYIDFRFKNNSGYAMLIEAEVVGNQIHIAAWGRAPEVKTTFRIRTVVVEKLLTQEIEIVKDDALKPGTMEIIHEAVPGYRVEVYRDTLNASGKVIDTEKISEDFYPPQKKKIKVAADQE